MAFGSFISFPSWLSEEWSRRGAGSRLCQVGRRGPRGIEESQRHPARIPTLCTGCGSQAAHGSPENEVLSLIQSWVEFLFNKSPILIH